MSDKQRAFFTVFGYAFFWFLAIVQYFIIVGIMNLVSMVIPSDANAWLVGLIILALMYIHRLGRLGTKMTVDKMNEKS